MKMQIHLGEENLKEKNYLGKYLSKIILEDR